MELTIAIDKLVPLNINNCTPSSINVVSVIVRCIGEHAILIVIGSGAGYVRHEDDHCTASYVREVPTVPAKRKQLCVFWIKNMTETLNIFI